jgi:hypothetical protein
MILDLLSKFGRTGLQTRLATTFYEEEAQDEAEAQQRPKEQMQNTIEVDTQVPPAKV